MLVVSRFCHYNTDPCRDIKTFRALDFGSGEPGGNQAVAVVLLLKGVAKLALIASVFRGSRVRV